jgi:proteasome lid subunit RPN8/RPN11
VEGEIVIRIPGLLLREIHGHAERDYPHECCGALLGRVSNAAPVGTPGLDADGGETREVVALQAAANRRETAVAPRRFLITADDYRAIERAARARQLDILGFYHSHPDHPARPSEYDREHALPGYSYVIVSVNAGRVEETTSWVLADDRRGFGSERIVADATT